MSRTQKTFSVRLVLSNRELATLWQLHLAFHQKLNELLQILIKALDGQAGDTEREGGIYKKYVEFILAADIKNAKYLFNGLTLEKWVSKTAERITVKIKKPDGELVTVKGSELTPELVKLLDKGKKLFSKKELFDGLPGWAGDYLLTDAAIFLSGHRARVEQWRTERELWLKEKALFEKNNEQYLKIRPRLVAFQIENSKNFSPRRKRWKKYLEFLAQNPELAAWRGEPAEFHPISPKKAADTKKSPESGRSDLKAAEFFAANPELEALDAIHAEYEKKYAPRMKKINGQWSECEGFKLAPKLTLPHPSKHPRWLMLNSENTSPAGYRNLVLPKEKNKTGEITLKLLDENKAVELQTFKFKGDLRLTRISQEIHEVPRKNKSQESAAGDSREDRTATTDNISDPPEEIGRVKKLYFYDDKMTGEARIPVEIKSARLHFAISQSGEPQRAYLDFSVRRQNPEWSSRAQKVALVPTAENPPDPAQINSKTTKRLKMPDGITVAFVHLGIATAAYAVLATGSDGELPTILDCRKLWLSHKTPEGWAGEPKIKHILAHDRQLRQKAEQCRQLVKGEKFAPKLRRHINKMEEDRYKKTGRRIVDFAINRENRTDGNGQAFPRADLIIVGDFFGVSATGENRRWLNRLIRLWKLPKLIKLLRDLASEAGIKCLESSSLGTSSICSRCSHVGQRYLITRKAENNPPRIVFDPRGRHFACADCGYRENAEKNAALNLANITFYGKKWLINFEIFLSESAKDKASRHQEIQAKLLAGEKSLTLAF